MSDDDKERARALFALLRGMTFDETSVEHKHVTAFAAAFAAVRADEREACLEIVRKWKKTRSQADMDAACVDIRARSTP